MLAYHYEKDFLSLLDHYIIKPGEHFLFPVIIIDLIKKFLKSRSELATNLFSKLIEIILK